MNQVDRRCRHCGFRGWRSRFSATPRSGTTRAYVEVAIWAHGQPVALGMAAIFGVVSATSLGTLLWYFGGYERENRDGPKGRSLAAGLKTERAERERSHTRFQKVAGVLLSAAGVVAMMGIITGEALYPAPYDTTANTISDLGGTMPSEGGVVLQPSAAIFDATMLVVGTMVVAGAYCVHRAFGRWGTTIPLTLFGIGALGVGMFPGNVPVVHPIFAMVAFFSGGIAAILSYRIAMPPFGYVSAALGVVSQVCVVLGLFFLDWGFIAALGIGGIERWMVYPAVLWLVVFGGYLMGQPER